MGKKSLLLLVMLLSGVMLYFSNTEIRAKKISKIKKFNKISIKGIKTTMRDRILVIKESKEIAEKWGDPKKEYIGIISKKDVTTFSLSKGKNSVLLLRMRYRDGSTRDWFVGEDTNECIGLAYIDNLENDEYQFSSDYICVEGKLRDKEHLIFYEFSRDINLVKKSLGLE